LSTADKAIKSVMNLMWYHMSKFWKVYLKPSTVNNEKTKYLVNFSTADLLQLNNVNRYNLEQLFDQFMSNPLGNRIAGNLRSVSYLGLAGDHDFITSMSSSADAFYASYRGRFHLWNFLSSDQMVFDLSSSLYSDHQYVIPRVFGVSFYYSLFQIMPEWSVRHYNETFSFITENLSPNFTINQNIVNNLTQHLRTRTFSNTIYDSLKNIVRTDGLIAEVARMITIHLLSDIVEINFNITTNYNDYPWAINFMILIYMYRDSIHYMSDKLDLGIKTLHTILFKFTDPPTNFNTIYYDNNYMPPADIQQLVDTYHRRAVTTAENTSPTLVPIPIVADGYVTPVARVKIFDETNQTLTAFINHIQNIFNRRHVLSGSGARDARTAIQYLLNQIDTDRLERVLTLIDTYLAVFGRCRRAMNRGTIEPITRLKVDVDIYKYYSIIMAINYNDVDYPIINFANEFERDNSKMMWTQWMPTIYNTLRKIADDLGLTDVSNTRIIKGTLEFVGNYIPEANEVLDYYGRDIVEFDTRLVTIFNSQYEEAYLSELWNIVSEHLENVMYVYGYSPSVTISRCIESTIKGYTYYRPDNENLLYVEYDLDAIRRLKFRSDSREKLIDDLLNNDIGISIKLPTTFDYKIIKIREGQYYETYVDDTDRFDFIRWIDNIADSERFTMGHLTVQYFDLNRSRVLLTRPSYPKVMIRPEQIDFVIDMELELIEIFTLNKNFVLVGPDTFYLQRGTGH
jgi:DNA-binding ferritin-like protein (Dps family)